MSSRILYEARSVIEGAAAAFAAARATAADLQALDALLDSIEQEPADSTAISAVHLQFHFGIVAAGKNQVLSALYAQIVQIIEQHHGPLYRLIMDRAHEIKSHRALLEAVETGNPEIAAGAMRAHLEDVEETRQNAIRGGLSHSVLEP